MKCTLQRICLLSCFLVFAATFTAAGPKVVNMAGSGPVGWDNGLFRGDGSVAADAYLNAPTGIARSIDDRVLIADYWSDRIRVLDTTGQISTVGGDGWPGNLGDGKALTSPLWGPWDVALRGSTVVFSDTFNASIRGILADGTLTRVAGTMSGNPGDQGNPFGGWSGFSGDGGQATSARLNWPTGVCTDAAGSIYVADTWNQRIRKIATNGVITTVAGDGWADQYGRGRYSGDGGPALQASLYWPSAVAVDTAGNLYIADTYNHRIRRVDASSKTIMTIAGTGKVGGEGDGGPATSARLNHPAGIALASNDRLYIADTMNHRIREVSNGVISTVAGSGQRGLSGDNGEALNATFNEPKDLVVMVNGDLTIADTGNNRIRMVLFQDTVTLTGVVRDAVTLDPLPGAKVSWHGIQVTADGNGAYALPVYLGEQTVAAKQATYGAAVAVLSVVEGLTHDFLLPSGFVNVRVVDDAGHSLAGARVVSSENEGITGPDGMVRLRMPPGAQQISASLEGYVALSPVTVQVVASEAANARVTLYRTRSVLVALNHDTDWISTHANPGDYTIAPNDFAFPAEELPLSGSVATVVTPNGDVSFQIPHTTDGAKNAVRVNGQTINVPAGHYVAVHMLEAAQFGTFTGNVVLRYADGGATTIATVWTDWAWNAIGSNLSPYESVAFPCSHRHGANNPQASPPVDILRMTLPVDPARTLTGISLPVDSNTSTQNPHVFSVTVSAIGGDLYGDTDGNSTISVADVSLALRAVSGLGSLDPDGIRRADVWPVAEDDSFGDGVVDLGDALRILMFLR